MLWYTGKAEARCQRLEASEGCALARERRDREVKKLLTFNEGFQS